MNLKRYNGEFYIMEYEETEEKNLKLFVDVLNKSYQEIINFFNFHINISLHVLCALNRITKVRCSQSKSFLYC